MSLMGERARRSSRRAPDYHDPALGPHRRRRRQARTPLVVALLSSAVIVQLLLPLAYFLFRVQDVPPAPIEVEVAVIPGPSEEATTVPQPTVPARRVRRRTLTAPPAIERPKPPPRQRQPVPPPEKTPEARLKMVEVNNPASESPPEHVRYLSDKNRRVERETRARLTNLQRDAAQPVTQTDSSAAKEPGRRERKIAEDRKLEHKRRHVRPAPSRKLRRSPLLAMRQQVSPPPSAIHPAPPTDATGQLSAPHSVSSGRTPRSLDLDHRDFDRIYGAAAAQARRQARAAPSSTKGGGVAKRWQRIRAALENFVPEVQPGNQTALGTRADPFALYLAQMHRGIHKLWGFGFLEDLDHQPDGHRLNDMGLWTMVEVVVSPAGQVAKATIVRPSGELPFDTAALDTVFSASPYPPSPRAIRSADGNVYLHWRFHRNHRQCGTFGVDPYILTTPPDGPIDGPRQEIGRQPGTAAPGPKARANPAADHPPHGPGGHPLRRQLPPRRPPRHPPRARHAERPAPPRAQPRATAGPDQAAAAAVDAFLDAFHAGSSARMAQHCKLPFLAHGRPVATTRKDLQRMLGDLLNESAQRNIARGPLMTPVTARGKLGRLPKGVEYGEDSLLTSVSLGDTGAILLLKRDNGSWRVAGLNQ